MDNKIVAFVGSECFDYVHYLVRTAEVLGKSCLVVDKTTEHELLGPITEFDGSTSVVIGKTEFTCDLVIKQPYDYVFVYYGWDYDGSLASCEEVYLCIDTQKNSIRKIAAVPLMSQYRALLIRTFYDTKSYKSYVKLITQHFQIGDESIYELTFAPGDMEGLLESQYNQAFNFSNISASTVDFITAFFSTEFPAKIVRKAIKTASKK